MMEVTPNEALRHMINLLSPESQYVAYHALDAIEAQLAEANEAARLQVALDRIEKAGYSVDIRWMFDGEIMYSVELTDSKGECYLYDDFHLTIRDAAEAGAAWCEAQKEAAHE